MGTSLLVLLFSSALALVALRYYRQESRRIEFFRDEQKGVAWARRIVERMVEIASSPVVSDVQLDATVRLLGAADELVFRSSVFRSEAALHRLNDPDRHEAVGFRQAVARLQTPGTGDRQLTLLRALGFYRGLLLDQSNLLFDPEFRTYYLMDAFLLAFPGMFVAGETAVAAFPRDPTSRAVSAAYLERHLRSLNRALLAQERLSQEEGVGRSLPESLRTTSRSFEAQFREALAAPVETRPAVLARLVPVATHHLSEGLGAFASINQRRIEQAQRSATLALTASAILWTISVLVTGFAAYFLLRAQTVLRGVIQEQWAALDRAQRLAVLGEGTASIGHEIAGPLMVIKATTETLERLSGGGAVSEQAALIRRMVDRIDGIIGSIRSLVGRRPETPLSAVMVRAVFEDTLLLVKRKLDEHEVALDLSGLDLELCVRANESELVRVFVNLIGNAVDAVRGTDHRNVSISSRVDAQLCRIRVQDTGPGVPAAIRGHIFEALFTTKAASGGTGLGLSIAQAIVRRFGGDLRYIPGDSGACFEVELWLA